MKNRFETQLCQRCGGHLEFEAADLIAPTAVICPHCNNPTILTPPAAPPTIGQPAARIVQVQPARRSGGRMGFAICLCLFGGLMTLCFWPVGVPLILIGILLFGLSLSS